MKTFLAIHIDYNCKSHLRGLDVEERFLDRISRCEGICVSHGGLVVEVYELKEKGRPELKLAKTGKLNLTSLYKKSEKYGYLVGTYEPRIQKNRSRGIYFFKLDESKQRLVK